MYFSNIDYFYGPYLICKCTYTHMYKFKPFPILFYLEQLAAVVFGKQECMGHVHIFKTEGFLVKVCMCLYICVCSNFSLKLLDQ